MTEITDKNSHSCEQVRENLSAQLDGEQRFIGNSDVEKHLRLCSDCREFRIELKHIHSTLSEDRSMNCNPDDIWQKVVTRIEAVEGISIEGNTQEKKGSDNEIEGFNISRRAVVGFSIAASLLAGVVIGVNTTPTISTLDTPLLTETVRDYETFLARGTQLDINAGNRDEIVSWMSAKLDFELPETVDTPVQFKIAGGRLCSFLNRRLAFFYYTKNENVLSLYVMKAQGLDIPNRGKMKAVSNQSGLTTVTWRRDELAYVIVSDLPVDDVMQFASRS